jgi:hypothetical protein
MITSLKCFFKLFSVAQNLEGNFRITSGANFTADLKNKNSDAFKTLAIQIEQMVRFNVDHLSCCCKATIVFAVNMVGLQSNLTPPWKTKEPMC